MGAIALMLLGVGQAQAQPFAVDTAFTYQGQLTSGGVPVNGTCDFQFSLWNASIGGAQIGSTQTKTGVAVSAGYFTIPDLDFGVSAFNGGARWLGIAVRCPAGSGSYTALSPRQPLRAAPYAHSLRPGALVTGAPTSQYIISAEHTSTTGTGVYGLHAATTGTAPGVRGATHSTDDSAVGVLGEVTSSAPGEASAAVLGINNGTGVNGIGVWGAHAGSGLGVYGFAGANGVGVYGTAGAGGHAGYFSGNVSVIGNLSKSSGSFKIDHPLNAENKYLYHSFVESPDMKNIYDGVARLDASGAAWVQLPEWFEALNTDFRYQLTPLGAAMPNLHVAEKIAGNRFRIAGGVAGMEVSWQVTGIRQDAYARANRIPVEVEKPAGEKGTYLHPEAFGQPKEKGLDYQRQAALHEAAEPAGGER